MRVTDSRGARKYAVMDGQIDLAARAVRAMGDLLGDKAQIFPEGLGSAYKYRGVINIGNLPLCLQFGRYRAQVLIVEDTLTFQGLEDDCEGSDERVNVGHLGITFRVDVEFVA